MTLYRRYLPVVFAFLMVFFVLFLIWYLPAISQRRLFLEDARMSLETSQGRERKQQAEYDRTVEAIPEVQAEIDRIAPLSSAAREEVDTLKSQRKKLREEKKELEKLIEQSGSQEADSHE